MMHRLQISHAVLEAEVQLLRDLLFEAVADPATAAKARTIYDERIQSLRAVPASPDPARSSRACSDP